MKAQYALVFVPVLGLGLWWLHPTAAKSALRESTPSAALQVQVAKEGSRAEPDKMSASAEKIEALQAELKFKNALLQKVMIESATAAQVPAEERTARIIENTAKILDQRVFDARHDEAESERMENALGQITAKLPTDVKTETLCGATICRLLIRGSEDAIGSAATQVGTSITKDLFGGTTVLPTGEGQSTIYLARNPAQLDVSPEGTLALNGGSPNEAQPAAKPSQAPAAADRK